LKSVPVVVDSRVDDLEARELLTREVLLAREVLLPLVVLPPLVVLLLRPAPLLLPVPLPPLLRLLRLLLPPLPLPPLPLPLLLQAPFQVQTTRRLALALVMLLTSNPR
jgi:hypothetical protein